MRFTAFTLKPLSLAAADRNPSVLIVFCVLSNHSSASRTSSSPSSRNGTSLTGSLSHAEHHVAISGGKVAGNILSWSAQIDKPMRMNFKFTATVEEDRISGSAKYLLGKATFAGTRA